MAIKAKLRYLHIAPRKVRLVADLIRGKEVIDALGALKFISNRSAEPIIKLLKSAIANAKDEFQFNENDLFISKIMVDGGPIQKRWRPRSRGQAFRILKRSSHITIVLDKKGAEKAKTKLKSVSNKVPESSSSDTKTILDKKETEKKPSVADKTNIDKTDVKGKENTDQIKLKQTKEKYTDKSKTQVGAPKIFRRKSF